MPSTNRGGSILIGALMSLALLAPTLEAQTAQARTSPVQTKGPFMHERFQELQAQGALVLVDIWASWCPDCAAQQRALDAYRASHPDVQLHTLVVDFDKQKDVVTYFRAPRQSTLILYRGTERLWFSVAETRAEMITQALNEAVAGR